MLYQKKIPLDWKLLIYKKESHAAKEKKTSRSPRPTEARREENKKPNSRNLENLKKLEPIKKCRKPQKHLEREQPSGKTDGSTSCKETAPGPSKDQQNKVANATSSPSTPGEKRKKTQKDKVGRQGRKD
ncbi:hypothetical protein J6590_090920 [Homalodisca vitripennis]|nr:hypothetical protein J6590_090920 [Homalodisca vitripennis]